MLPPNWVGDAKLNGEEYVRRVDSLFALADLAEEGGLEQPMEDHAW